MDCINSSFDVCIIGGGISGSLFALNLIKKQPNLSILIIEKSECFQMKVGEATSDISSMFLHRLGIDHILAKQQKKAGLRFLFNHDGNVKEFSSPSIKSIANGYHLNRGVLDEDLIQECISKGVSTVRPISFVDVLQINDTGNEIEIIGEDWKKKIHAKWLVDATGKFRFLHKKMNWKNESIELNTGAISSYVKNITPNHLWDTKTTSKWKKSAIEHQSFSTIHFMQDHAWWWMIKIDEETTSLGIVYDKTYISFSDAQVFFIDSIKKHPILSQVLREGELCEIRNHPSVPYVGTHFHYKNSFVLGEAGAFIDPLFSSGLDFICQQNEYLTNLLLNDLKDGIKNERKWNKYEQKIKKSYLDRAFIHKRIYDFTSSYDIFTNLTQFIFFGYQSFGVIPIKLFPKKMKNFLVLNLLSKIGFNYLFSRYKKILNKQKKKPVLSQQVIYSNVSIPNGLKIFLIPPKLFFLWFLTYIKIERKLITNKNE